MSCATDVVITEASRGDIQSLYGLAAPALTLDRFSERLLESKLFDNPRPDSLEFKVFVATRGKQIVGFMQSVVNRTLNKAWLGIHVVQESCRRHRIATKLFDSVRGHWTDSGATEAEVLAIPGNYFNPGIDPRYTESLAFVESQGFTRFKDCVNLDARLDRHYETSEFEAELIAKGVEVRRVSREDDALLDAFFAQDFGPDWRLEVELAMKNEPPALHIAIKDGEMIAFSAHSTQNHEWGFFGPMGTTPKSRGLGLGRILLQRCLNDMRDAGHENSVIPWVGPIGFYSRYCGAKVTRVFWRYKLEL